MHGCKPQNHYTLGARGAALSKAQIALAKSALSKAYPDCTFTFQEIVTLGDQIQDRPISQIGEKGVFTKAIDEQLQKGNIDFAVHSQKDLPTEDSSGLFTGAILERSYVEDVLICRQDSNLKTLPTGSTVGTSSTRRKAQLLKLRPDLKTLDIRGNVGTRLKKLTALDGPFDAIILARAGLARLGLTPDFATILSTKEFLPAPAQGAVAIQCRADNKLAKPMLSKVNHEQSQLETTAERAFLNHLGSGCSLPLSALARLKEDSLTLETCITDPQILSQIQLNDAITLDSKMSTEDKVASARALGVKLAESAKKQGAMALLYDTP